MKKYIETYYKGLINGLGFLTVIGLTGVAYGAYVAMTDVTTGQSLTASTFNQVLENVRVLRTDVDKSSPAGFIGAFNLSSCPTGWIPADGTVGTPDLRGTFIRGMNGSINGRDISRTLGSYQTDTFQGHRHQMTSETPGSNNVVAFSDTNGDSTYASGGNPGFRGDVYIYVGDPSTDNTNGTPRTSTETRPKNITLLYCVKQ